MAERAKAFAALEKGPSFAAEAERRPTLYVVDPKGAFKHVWMLQVWSHHHDTVRRSAGQHRWRMQA